MRNSCSPGSPFLSCSFSVFLCKALNLLPPPYSAHSTVSAHGFGVTLEKFLSLSSASESHLCPSTLQDAVAEPVLACPGPVVATLWYFYCHSWPPSLWGEFWPGLASSMRCVPALYASLRPLSRTGFGSSEYGGHGRRIDQFG